MLINFGMLAEMNPLEHVVPHVLFRFHLLGREIAFTNHMLMAGVAAALMMIFFPLVARGKGMVPRGMRNFIEAICVFLREEVARPSLGHNTDKYIKYIWTTFFFILFCNLLGMVPTGGILFLATGGSKGILAQLGGTATANIWVTGTLALIAFFVVHISGMIEQGPWLYIKNFIPHVPAPLIPVMYLLELIGALVKPFALAVRLFANMLAGHTVLASLLGLIFMAHNWAIGITTIIGCVALSLLELFVAFLQAYIFTYLTTMFIAGAVHPEH